jgi:hypothetical protein
VQQRASYTTMWRSDLQSRVEASQGNARWSTEVGKDTLEFLFILIFIVKEEIKPIYT